MGGGTPLAKVIFDSLAAARGDAIAASTTGTVAYVETLALARAIAGGWMTNERLANQWDANRMTSLLPRWEKIFGITPLPTDTMVERRARIAAAQARVGKASLRALVASEAQRVLGSFYVGVEYIDPSSAHIKVPNDGNSYPFGSPSDAAPWASTVAHVLIKVTVPTGRTDAELYELTGELEKALEPMMPAWATWKWYRAPELGTPKAVSGGASATGFYLDERNLNESLFSDYVPTPFTPASLSLSGWWRASYSASPWAGVASAGGSGARNLTEATFPPAPGATLNGFAPADFDGAQMRLTNANTVGTFFSASAWTMVVLFNANGVSQFGADEYDNPSLISTRGGAAEIGMALSDLGVSVWHGVGGGSWPGVSVACPPGGWHLAQAKFGSGTMKLRVDSSDFASVAAGNLATTAETLQIGLDWSGTKFFGGRIAEIILAPTALSDATLDDIKNYINTRYGLFL